MNTSEMRVSRVRGRVAEALGERTLRPLPSGPCRAGAWGGAESVRRDGGLDGSRKVTLWG